MVSKLSGATRNLTSGLLQDPQKMESAIGMVRTLAPLTSPQTVAKVNTYLPAVEKISTLMSMYTFINKAQNFKPVTALDAKTPADKITALVKNGNIPLGKLMAQPLLANNMDKILGPMAMNMVKNGGLDEMLSSFSKGNKSGLNELFSSLSKGNDSGLNELLSSLSKGNNSELGELLSSVTKEKNDSTDDLSSLIETFKPMLNSLMSSSNTPEESIEAYRETTEPTEPIFKSAKFDYSLEEDGQEENIVATPPSIEREFTDENYPQKPIRIRQRRRK